MATSDRDRPVVADTHAHVALQTFDADRDSVLARARAAGVQLIVCPGIDIATSRAAVALAESVRGVGAAVGVHPLDVASWTDSCEEALHLMARQPSVVAIGETGLDFGRGRETEGAQRRAFSAQAQLARALNLPLMVHNRQADDAIVAVLDSCAPRNVVLHCFTGGAQLARHAVEHGWYLGFGGILTYRSGACVAALLPTIPPERIVLETDSPYLAPHPDRGRRNEPANVVAPLGVVARSLGVSLGAAASMTTANACRLFPRLQALCTAER